MFKKYFNFKNFDLLIGKKDNVDFLLKEKDRNNHTLIFGKKEINKVDNLTVSSIIKDTENKNMGIIIIEQNEGNHEKFKDIFNKTTKKVLNLNPTINNNIKFNPLIGAEKEVVKNMCNAFIKINNNESIDFLNFQRLLIKNSLILLKRHLKDDLTFIDLNIIINNENNEGLSKYIIPFQEKISLIEENTFYKISSLNIIDWFLSHYKDKEYFYKTKFLRLQLNKITNNKILKNFMIDINQENDIILDFNNILSDNYIVNICTCEKELRELSDFLGIILIDGILNALYHRKAHKSIYRLYINNIETYANEKIIKLFCIGEHFNTFIFSTINDFDSLEPDIRNIIIRITKNLFVFTGQTMESSKYFSDIFKIDSDKLYENDNKFYCRLSINNNPEDVFILDIL